MKMTIQEKTDMLNVQYILEYLIEHYDKATYESEKYRIKLMLFDFIKDTNVCLDTIKDYMSLDEDKFEPFIKLLDNVVDDQPSSNSKTEETEDSSFEMMAPISICLFRRSLK